MSSLNDLTNPEVLGEIGRMGVAQGERIGEGCPWEWHESPPPWLCGSVRLILSCWEHHVCASLTSKATNPQEDTRLKKNSLNEVGIFVESLRANTKSRRL